MAWGLSSTIWGLRFGLWAVGAVLGFGVGAVGFRGSKAGGLTVPNEGLVSGDSGVGLLKGTLSAGGKGLASGAHLHFRLNKAFS